MQPKRRGPSTGLAAGRVFPRDVHAPRREGARLDGRRDEAPCSLPQRGVGFLFPCAGENPEQSDVPFVAGVFEQWLVGALEQDPGVHGRVHVEGSFMVASYCSVSAEEAREALDQLQIVRHAHEGGLGREAFRVDDERVAFPVAARVANPLPDRIRQVWAAVDRDDAGSWIVSIRKTTWLGDWTIRYTLLYAAWKRGTPKVRHRSLKPRLSGPSAGKSRRRSAAAARRACAAGARGECGHPAGR